MLGVYTIKDKITEQFMQPIYLHNEDEAKRLFSYQLENTPLWKDNAEQFYLFKTACFDQESGVTIGLNEPDLICKGNDLISVKED